MHNHVQPATNNQANSCKRKDHPYFVCNTANASLGFSELEDGTHPASATVGRINGRRPQSSPMMCFHAMHVRVDEDGKLDVRELSVVAKSLPGDASVLQ